MVTIHPQHAFLQVAASSEITYQSSQAGDLGLFLELVRDHPQDVVAVTKVDLSSDFDSKIQSGAIAFVQSYASADKAQVCAPV
jgi:hypothetical protein